MYDMEKKQRCQKICVLIISSKTNAHFGNSSFHSRTRDRFPPEESPESTQHVLANSFFKVS